MIPNSSEIRKKLTPQQIQYILLNNNNFFKLADNFVSLHEQFSTETILQKVSLWFDMIVSPIITLVQIVFFKKLPDLFTILSIQKTIQIWLKWFEWKEVQQKIREWIKIVRSIGGPFISCNDAKYHMYVYADGMQRIHNSLLLSTRVSKESTKSLK